MKLGRELMDLHLLESYSLICRWIFCFDKLNTLLIAIFILCESKSGESLDNLQDPGSFPQWTKGQSEVLWQHWLLQTPRTAGISWLETWAARIMCSEMEPNVLEWREIQQTRPPANVSSLLSSLLLLSQHWHDWISCRSLRLASSFILFLVCILSWLRVLAHSLYCSWCVKYHELFRMSQCVPQTLGKHAFFQRLFAVLERWLSG